MKKIVVVGLGGLGGFVVEELARLNLGELILIDGDKFDESNLDRQVLAREETLGRYKAECYEDKIKHTSKCPVKAYTEFITEDNLDLLKSDLVIDCLDNIDTRLMIEHYCGKKGIKIIHGAVHEDVGHVCVIEPGNKTLEHLYKKNIEKKNRATVYNIATVASIEVYLAKRVLEDNYDEFKGMLAIFDFEDLSIRKLKIK